MAQRWTAGVAIVSVDVVINDGDGGNKVDRNLYEVVDLVEACCFLPAGSEEGERDPRTSRDRGTRHCFDGIVEVLQP